MNQTVTVVFLLFCKLLKQNISHLLCGPAEECYIVSLASPEVEFLAMEKVRSGREKVSKRRTCADCFTASLLCLHVFSLSSIPSSRLSFQPPSRPTGNFPACCFKMILLNIRKKKED